MWTRDNLDAPYAPETESVTRITNLITLIGVVLWTVGSLLVLLLF